MISSVATEPTAAETEPVDMMPSSVLFDPDYRVPRPPAAAAGMGWLRAHVVRFCEGDLHRERRRLVERVIADLGMPRWRRSPALSLLAAMQLPSELADDVGRVAAGYQPHTATSADADAAADRLVAACGGRTELAAARVCVLVQAHAATPALIQSRRTGSGGAPVPTTRRIGADGRAVVVDLAGAPFGLGVHACPGRDVALHLARQALA